MNVLLLTFFSWEFREPWIQPLGAPTTHFTLVFCSLAFAFFFNCFSKKLHGLTMWRAYSDRSDQRMYSSHLVGLLPYSQICLLITKIRLRHWDVRHPCQNMGFRCWPDRTANSRNQLDAVLFVISSRLFSVIPLFFVVRALPYASNDGWWGKYLKNEFRMTYTSSRAWNSA